MVNFVVIGVGINLKLDALEAHQRSKSDNKRKGKIKIIKFVFKRLSKINEDNFLSDWKEGGEKMLPYESRNTNLPDEKKLFLCIDTSGRMIVQLDGERELSVARKLK